MRYLKNNGIKNEVKVKKLREKYDFSLYAISPAFDLKMQELTDDFLRTIEISE